MGNLDAHAQDTASLSYFAKLLVSCRCRCQSQRWAQRRTCTGYRLFTVVRLAGARVEHRMGNLDAHAQDTASLSYSAKLLVSCRCRCQSQHWAHASMRTEYRLASAVHLAGARVDDEMGSVSGDAQGAA
eukprot:1136799-Pelagomonas_calceolata.AAC.5